MKKLSIRKRGGGAYEVGPAGVGPAVVVTARGKPEALARGREKLGVKTLEAIRRMPTRFERQGVAR